ncbi:pre-mRNA cleavage complex 2 protein Pcf11-like protein, partial [Aphelenchoides avenae]
DSLQLFRQELRQLVSNDKRQIGLLTDLAERYIDFAPDVAQIVEDAIRHAVPQRKILHLQLLDAICQKVRGHEDVYSRLFAEKVITLSLLVFNTAGSGRVYNSMLVLRRKWNGVFPADRLLILDTRLNEIDRRWPIGSRAAGVGHHQTDYGNATPRAQEADPLPFLQAQLDLEAAKRRGCKRENKVLREHYVEEKKARIETQEELSKTAAELAVHKEHTAVAVRERQEVSMENKTLRTENSELKAQNAELEHANRALKAGENAAELKKQIRPEDTVYCGGNDPNEVVTEGKSVAEVVCGFRLCMQSKPIRKNRGPVQEQVYAYVDAYLQYERFPSEEKRHEVRKQLAADGCRIVFERKQNVVKGMLKHL